MNEWINRRCSYSFFSFDIALLFMLISFHFFYHYYYPYHCYWWWWSTFFFFDYKYKNPYIVWWWWWWYQKVKWNKKNSSLMIGGHINIFVILHIKRCFLFSSLFFVRCFFQFGKFFSVCIRIYYIMQNKEYVSSLDSYLRLVIITWMKRVNWMKRTIRTPVCMVKRLCKINWMNGIWLQ